MKNYLIYNIIAKTPDPDETAGLFWELDISGVEITPDGFKVFSENSDDYSGQLKNILVQNGYEVTSVTLENIENKNWNKEWESTIQVIRVSNKIVIKPTFREYTAQPDELVLTIDPKMSFGTGEHQTTKLVLLALEKYIRPGMKMLDAGSGTGVLAIAGVKLGAKEALAFDNDEWCYENSIENVHLNGVEGKVTIRVCDISGIHESEFDLITANIQKNILLPIAPNLAEKLKTGGILILSGLYREDEEEIIREYSAQGLQHSETTSMDEWISIVFNK